MKNWILLSLLFVLGSIPQLAQAQFDPNNTPSGFAFQGTIKGIVVDSLTQKPVEYAAVSVLQVRDSSIAGGMVTDETGQFIIEQLKPGRYIVRIKFIGYTERKIKGLTLSPEKPVIDLKNVYVVSAAENLEGVDIVHNTEVLEANLDKRVINVEKDLTSVGGTALDVMKNVPSVQVDMDNTVSLRGNSNIRILIDGRLTTMDPTTLLTQIPASMVKQIEVITNPSAKYDPDGVSGIINIITKKERKPGYNGLITAGIGTGSNQAGGGMDHFALNKYNLSTSMNYQVGKFNFFGSYDGRYGVRWNEGAVYRELFVNDTLTDILDQVSGKLSPSWNHTGKLGADIQFNEKNTLTVSGLLRSEKGDPNEDINYIQFLEDGEFIQQFTRTSQENNTEFNYDANLNYKHLFKGKGHELVFDGSYSNIERDRKTMVRETYFDQSGDAFSVDSVMDDISEFGTRHMITAQLDYVNPTEKYGRFEAGLKFFERASLFDINTITNSGYDYMFEDPNRTNAFKYREDLLSAYFIYGNVYKKFKYQAGLRFEQAFTESRQVTLNQLYERDFYNFFPSLHLKYAPKEENEFSFSYSKRITRPGNNQLNPYPDYTDKYNYRVGNPYLKPEFTHSLELSYGKFSKKIMITGTLFYRTTVNSIYRVKTIDNNTGISVVSFSNINQTHSTGVEFTYNQSVTKWLRLNGNISGFHFLLEESQEYNTPRSENLTYTTRLSANFVVTKTFDVQLTGNYKGPNVTPQGKMRAMGNIDLGCKKDFWNKKASLSFRITDIFNTQRFSLVASDFNYYSTVYHKWESRTANITFTYKINQGVEKREKPRTDQGGGGGDFGG